MKIKKKVWCNKSKNNVNYDLNKKWTSNIDINVYYIS